MHFWYLSVNDRHSRHTFKATNTEQEVAFEDAQNAKAKVLYLKNRSC